MIASKEHTIPMPPDLHRDSLEKSAPSRFDIFKAEMATAGKKCLGLAALALTVTTVVQSTTCTHDDVQKQPSCRLETALLITAGTGALAFAVQGCRIAAGVLRKSFSHVE